MELSGAKSGNSCWKGWVGPGEVGGGWICVISVLSQGQRGNSLDRRSQGGHPLSGAVGEEIRPLMNRKPSDHPLLPPSQYPPAPLPAQQRYLPQHHFNQVPGKDKVGTGSGGGPALPPGFSSLVPTATHCVKNPTVPETTETNKCWGPVVAPGPSVRGGMSRSNPGPIWSH